ncbi:uncharacterized protein LOC119009022 isoform X13 [Acanthopagrus latus]|uniref:uncharacterized protein LOC119009022 isoform X13 n=1 Tax=Acanthopagrus latus TaxID=8177 RepID=UPI00187CD3F7|nr:uncharacterized protein LOC119009022 isoform X13 [Acanthopagrus latus]
MFTKTTKEHKSVLMRTVALTEDNFSEMTHAPLHRPQSPASSYSSDQGSNKQRQTRQQPHVPALGLPSLGVKTDTEKAGKMEISDATRSVSSASTHLHHCHISWSQGCEVMQTSGPSAMFSKGVLGSEAQRRVKCGPFFLRLPVFGPFRRLREASRCHDATPACDATRANILR